jgi:hypothetical protein
VIEAINGFINAISALPEELPPNFENGVRPYSAELRAQLKIVADWIAETRSAANSEIQKLRN